MRAYGEKGTHEADLTLTVPSKVATTGEVIVYDSSGYEKNDSSDPSRDSGMAARVADPNAIPDSPTLADLSADVATWQDNDVLNATLVADTSNEFVGSGCRATSSRPPCR